MKNKLFALCFLWMNIAFAQVTSKPINVIPYPNYIQQSDGVFRLSDTTIIVADESSYEAQYLKYYLKKNYDIEVKIDAHYPPFKNFISLLNTVVNNAADMNQESYQIKVTKKGVTINAVGNAGLFYGVQTLLQLLPVEKAKVLSVPCLQIADEPRYQWRGMHLDCSRHFFTKDEVMMYLDYLAMYKFNIFHWHLVDDQGWRIEIKKYPKLTTVGGQRKETIIGKPKWDKQGNPSKDDKYDGKPYGGFYTQEDIKEVLAYATKKHITVVPEIEMPGHSLAALAAYPQYSCTGGPFETFTKWGVSDDVYCAGNDSVFTFLEDILTEVMELFPGRTIHIGGDECLKERWKACPKCQKRMKDENLKNAEELQSYFIKRIEKFVNGKERQIIGWDEILEGGLAPNAAVMSWRGTEGGIAAAKQNHAVVMSPGKPCYFDHYQSKDKTKEPLAIGGYNPIDSVYNYDPTPKSLSVSERNYILGAQGNVWTEYIVDFKQVEYMAVPRMSALSEVLWTKPENKNFSNFIERLKVNSKILDRMKVNYAKHFMQTK